MSRKPGCLAWYHAHIFCGEPYKLLIMVSACLIEALASLRF